MHDAQSDAIRFSVIIPAHDAESTIAAAVDSVLAQQRHDTEVIVVDDASTDATRARAQEVSAGAARVRVLGLDRNVGVSSARNAGLAIAHGEVIVFLDADDVHLPGFLAVVDRALTGDVDAVVMGRRVDTGSTSRTAHAAALGIHSGPDAARAMMRDQITPFPWDKAFRRDLLGQDPFPAGIARFEDLTTVVAALARARRVLVLAEPVIAYRISSGSLTWGRVPSREERDAALSHMRAVLPPALRRDSRADQHRLFVLLTVLIAQGAALHAASAPEGSPERTANRELLRRCRSDLTLRDAIMTASANRAAGAAAAMLRISPALFSRVVALRTRRAYGASATSTSAPSTQAAAPDEG